MKQVGLAVASHLCGSGHCQGRDAAVGVWVSGSAVNPSDG